MKITSIKESGCSNTLMWAIKNGASLFNDDALISIINDELFYLVSVTDVSFMELIGFSKVYRDKLRILMERTAYVPGEEELAAYFPSQVKLEDKTFGAHLLAKEALDKMTDIVFQTEVDDDIISAAVSKLLLPMITRKFDIQIPVSFVDIISNMKPEEAAQLFSSDYQDNLAKLADDNTNQAIMVLYTGMINMTKPIEYPIRYEKYLKATKYFPLPNSNSQRQLCKANLLGMCKFNKITRGEVRVSTFNMNKEEWSRSMKLMAGLDSPLNVDFAVQMPLQYLQNLLNDFSDDVMKIRYISSIRDIVDNGFSYEDFIHIDESDENFPVARYNSISAYKLRLGEATQATLTAIAQLRNGDNIDTIYNNNTATFALLPSIYSVKAVITLSSEHLESYAKETDLNLSSMLNNMTQTMKNIMEELSTIR